jgi:hypothetical protein
MALQHFCGFEVTRSSLGDGCGELYNPFGSFVTSPVRTGRLSFHPVNDNSSSHESWLLIRPGANGVLFQEAAANMSSGYMRIYFYLTSYPEGGSGVFAASILSMCASSSGGKEWAVMIDDTGNLKYASSTGLIGNAFPVRAQLERWYRLEVQFNIWLREPMRFALTVRRRHLVHQINRRQQKQASR